MCKCLLTGAIALLLVLVLIIEVESSSSSSSSVGSYGTSLARGNHTSNDDDEELTELHIGGIFPINGKGGW